MPRWIALLTLLCLPVFAPPDASASARVRAPVDKELGKELKRAEAVLSKLRRLEAAAASDATGDGSGFRKAARKLYPGLFGAVSELRDGDLKTDLSTAAALYEAALRAGGGRADCARELREAYARLCVETGGERARLLRAKARLHAGWAEAALLHARGVGEGVAPDSLDLIRAERETERALAEEALLGLKELAAVLDDGGLEESASGTLPRKLEQLDCLLSSLPRDRPARLLREARDAFRDGLYWRLRAAPARSLVVDVNSLDAAPPGVLPRLGLRADDADGAARANLRAAHRFIDRAEAALKR